MKGLVAMAAAALGGCAPAAFTEAQLTVYPRARGLPADVQAFVARYEDCEHFRSEPGYDAQRERDLAKAVRDVCSGIDPRAAALRARYQHNGTVMAALAEYEEIGL